MAEKSETGKSKIERFLQCELAGTLRHTYDAMWLSIKV